MSSADVFDILIVALGVGGVGWIIWLLRHGDTDRHDEDSARLFFDEHGHWPDETLEEAEAERARLAAGSYGPMPSVTTPGSDGKV